MSANFGWVKEQLILRILRTCIHSEVAPLVRKHHKTKNPQITGITFDSSSPRNILPQAALVRDKLKKRLTKYTLLFIITLGTNYLREQMLEVCVFGWLLEIINTIVRFLMALQSAKRFRGFTTIFPFEGISFSPVMGTFGQPKKAWKGMTTFTFLKNEVHLFLDGFWKS